MDLISEVKICTILLYSKESSLTSRLFEFTVAPTIVIARSSCHSVVIRFKCVIISYATTEATSQSFLNENCSWKICEVDSVGKTDD